MNNYVDEKWENFVSYTIEDLSDEYDGEDDSQSYEKQRVKDILNTFISNKSFCEYDEHIEFRVIRDILRDYVIGGCDVSSDCGIVELADIEQIKKILNYEN